MPEYVDAYDKATGNKLVDRYGSPRQVPEAFLDIFPNLARTPQGAASAARATQDAKPAKKPAAKKATPKATAKKADASPTPESDHDATGAAGAETEGV